MAVPEDDLPELDNMELSKADMLDESLDAADDGEQLTPAPKKKGLFGRGKAKAKKPKEKKK